MSNSFSQNLINDVFTSNALEISPIV
ncbi:uncharacterized protein METZ01_LOCUS33053 [marine metagenome]|uniref:Uncharacterized protein n=1 Tax=marine metagenome TaxID=408172 RepID=A0A381QNY7_9ZZZZ